MKSSTSSNPMKKSKTCSDPQIAPKRRRKPRGPKKKRLVVEIPNSQEVLVYCAYQCGRVYTTLPCHLDRNAWHRTLRKLNAHESQRCRSAPQKIKLKQGKNGSMTECEGDGDLSSGTSPASTASSSTEEPKRISQHLSPFSSSSPCSSSSSSSAYAKHFHHYNNNNLSSRGERIMNTKSSSSSPSSSSPSRRSSGERAGTILAELRRNTSELRRASATSTGSSEGEENGDIKTKKTLEKTSSESSIARALMSLMSPRSVGGCSDVDAQDFATISSSPRIEQIQNSAISSTRRRLSGMKRNSHTIDLVHHDASSVVLPSPRTRRRSVVGAVPGLKRTESPSSVLVRYSTL